MTSPPTIVVKTTAKTLTDKMAKKPSKTDRKAITNAKTLTDKMAKKPSKTDKVFKNFSKLVHSKSGSLTLKGIMKAE